MMFLLYLYTVLMLRPVASENSFGVILDKSSISSADHFEFRISDCIITCFLGTNISCSSSKIKFVNLVARTPVKCICIQFGDCVLYTRHSENNFCIDNANEQLPTMTQDLSVIQPSPYTYPRKKYLSSFRSRLGNSKIFDFLGTILYRCKSEHISSLGIVSITEFVFFKCDMFLQPLHTSLLIMSRASLSFMDRLNTNIVCPFFNSLMQPSAAINPTRTILCGNLRRFSSQKYEWSIPAVNLVLYRFRSIINNNIYTIYQS